LGTNTATARHPESLTEKLMRQVAGYSVADIARRFGCEVVGDPGVRVTHVASLQDAGPEAVAFVARPKYVRLLESTRAGAVIVSQENAAKCRSTALIARHPHAVYARVATLLHPAEPAPIGVHDSAIVDPSARIDASASVGAGCVIGKGARIGPRVRLGPHCIVMDDAIIGADTQLASSSA
jgi:UDP-3-O-[3-hydroxymyristoyl] glucosamine N-acyltransferase